MKEQVHILNGDSLSKILPDSIVGSKFSMRECLAQGPVDDKDLETFYQARASFIKTAYKIPGDINYDGFIVDELNKIARIDKNADINLWFENDVYCQVNFWFVLNFISRNKLENDIYLVSPKLHSPYLYSGHTSSELTQIFKNRIKIKNIEQWLFIWKYYKSENFDELSKKAEELEEEFPFLNEAVQAIKNRKSTPKNKGILIETLIEIKAELQTEEFSPIFKEFSKRLPIYGFGDLQVKYLLSQIVE